MDEIKQNHAEDELSPMDVFRFLKRQSWLILKVFFVVVLAAGVFVWSRGTVYQTTAIIEVGTKLQFIGATNLTIVEPLEQVIVRFGREKLPPGVSLDIKPVRNTNYLEIASRSAVRDDSVNVTNELSAKVIDQHKTIIEATRAEFKSYLEVINGPTLNKKSVLEMMDVGSAVSETHLVGNVETEVLRFGPNVVKIMAAAVLLGLILGLLAAVVKDNLGPRRKPEVGA